VFNSPVPQRLAVAEEQSTYNKYEELLRNMGAQVTVDYNIESLALAQSAMQKARRRDAIEAKSRKPDSDIDWYNMLHARAENLIDFEIQSLPLSNVIGMHPIFLFAEHARGFDSGSNQVVDLPVRGDSLSIPVVSEGDEVYFLSIGFHKGDMNVFFTYFPDRPLHIKDELVSLLNSWETR
jgi:hypothetical protein